MSLCMIINPKLIKEIYSTKEKCIGIWIDGQPLYRKVIDFGYLPAANEDKVVPIGLDTSKILVTKLYGVAKNEYNNTMTLPDVNNGIGCRLTVGLNAVRVAADYDRTTFYGYVVIEYIKNDKAI